MYSFGEFSLDPRRRTLFRGDSPVVLTPKAFDVLFFLVQNPNRLVLKEELLRAVWGDTFVEDGNLTQYISHLRKALGECSENARWIVTIARKGYQFAGDVVFSDQAAPVSQDESQVPATERSRTDAAPVSDVPGTEAAPSTSKSWRKEVGVALSILLLALVGYMFWRHSWSTALPRTEKVMLAVLPFENLTGDPNKDYLADGLTEETISQLGRLSPEQLGVIARTSVMGYKHKDERLDQIGRDLSVQYVLENSVRGSGDHMRLTAQLIQVKDQTQLWSQDYDYPVKDILAVEDDLARAVAREIQLHLTSHQQTESARPHPVNPEAFDAYLQGYYFFQRRTARDMDMAVKYYERATQLDPSYALAWVGLSRARYSEANEGLIPTEEGQGLAREAVDRALVLNPNLAAAHSQMGRIKRQVDFDWAGADASLQRAIALDPADSEILDAAAFSAAMLGHFDEALELTRRAIALDPLNAHSWDQLGEIEFYCGKLDKAESDLKKAYELSDDVFTPSFLSQIYVIQGRPQDALPEIELVRFGPDQRPFLYSIAYHALGRHKESDAALSELIDKFHAGSAYQIALVYAFRNQPNEAFVWLDRAYAQRDSGLVTTNMDPLLKSLHTDPRYAAFLKKLHLST